MMPCHGWWAIYCAIYFLCACTTLFAVAPLESYAVVVRVSEADYACLWDFEKKLKSLKIIAEKNFLYQNSSFLNFCMHVPLVMLRVRIQSV